MVEPSNKQTTTTMPLHPTIATTIKTKSSTWQLAAERGEGLQWGKGAASIMLRADYKSFAVEFSRFWIWRCVMYVGGCAWCVCVCVCLVFMSTLFLFEVLNINYVRNLILNCPLLPASFMLYARLLKNLSLIEKGYNYLAKQLLLAIKIGYI